MPKSQDNRYRLTLTLKESKMKKCILTLFILFSFFSCDIHKESQKSKTESSSKSDLQERIETWLKRKGDSVSYTVPQLKYRITWKDTIIYTVSKQGTVIKTYYGKDGQIYKIDCNAAAIDELRKEIRSLKQATDQATKDKKSEKTEQINPLFLLYGAIALVLIFAIGFYLLYRLIDKKTQYLNVVK